MSTSEIVGNLHVQATSFVGREEDLARISEMIAEPSCRLITLVGPGGIGKTRLAVQAAHNAGSDFPDGVYFVALQAVHSAEALITTIVDTLRLPLQGNETPAAQLVRYLRDKRLLFVLDNFEQLLEEVDLLLDVLENAPQVKLLVTSREVLNLRQEWVWPVTGLSYPDNPQIESAEKFGAVRLFVESAHRVRPDFSLEDDQASVIRICQIVEGVPLAIELAASWVKSLPCASILDEIRRNLDFLDTKLRDLPARHRSMRAVFNESWAQLSSDERAIFCRLAIFRGGFRREAAEEIVGATLPLLSTLIDKSLIRSEGNGRYHMHELLRQFAQEKLDEQPDLKTTLLDKHRDFYAAFLAQRQRRMVGPAPDDVQAQTMKDFDNIWAAWTYALEQCNESAIDQFLLPLLSLYHDQNRFYDGERIFRRALTCLHPNADDELTLTQARAYLCLALCLQNLTRYDEAFELVEKCLPTLEAHGVVWEIWNAQSCLANVAYSRGDYARAEWHFEQARALLKAEDDPSALVITLSRLSDLAGVRGDYQAAKRFLSEAISLLEASGTKRGRIRFLVTLGDIEYKLGNFEKAEAHFEQARTLSEATENSLTFAISLVSLGRVAYAVEDFGRAKQLCREAVVLYDEIRHLWGKAFALVHLGRSCMELEQFDEAFQHFSDATLIAESTGSQWLVAVCYFNQGRLHALLGRNESAFNDLYRALQIAIDIKTEPLILDVLVATAEAAVYTDETWALALASFVAQHHASEFTTQKQATVLLKRLKREPVNVAEHSVASMGSLTLSALLDGFQTPAPSLATVHEKVGVAEGLLDPLTERELEILQLLADGYTNQEIAERLILVLGTVKAHNHNIFSKLGVRNRVQAISRARELRLI